MKKITKIFLILLAPIFLTNCDEDDLPGPLDLLVGTWEATSIVSSGCTDPDQNGTLNCDPFCVSITINSDGTYTLIDGLEDPVSTESGLIEVTSSTILLCASGEECSQGAPDSYSLKDGKLTVSFSNDDAPGCTFDASFSKK